MEKLVLSDKDLSSYFFSDEVTFKQVTYKSIDAYLLDERVVAIAGSRAMAIKCATASLPSLKLFQLTSAGFDGVPCEEYAKRGVAVANAGGVYSAPIAETVVFGILQMAKRLRKNPNNRRPKFTRGYSEITELMGKKALVLGAGNIGTAVAKRLSAFEMQIDGYDPYCPEKAPYGRILRDRAELLGHVGEYDYVVCTLPDNEQTRGSLDKEFFSAMNAKAIIVNVGRRAVFNEDDFYTALKNKKIGGAVLDMFEKLPNPITNRFRRLKNVIVWPGVSAISRELNERLKKHMYANIISALEEKEISNVINGV